MNITHAMIANTCIRCVQDNSFTEDQHDELICLIEKFQSVKISNIWKFTKTFRQFETKYKEFGGNVEMLETGVRKIRDEQYLASAKMVPGIKIVKNGD